LPIASSSAALTVHLACESIAYAVAFALYARSRRAESTPALSADQSLGLLLGAALGAFVGSKLLSWLEAAPGADGAWSLATFTLQGKTIVGGLLGGWAGVEIAKRAMGIRTPTGDAFVPAFLAGLAIGRVGCFLAGLHDRTYGIATGLPWGVDFGDGIRRHPTQLYEIAFLGLLALALAAASRFPRPPGERFLLLVAAYLGFRFTVEFCKPRYPVVSGLSAIQLASLAGVAAALVQLARRRLRWRDASKREAYALA
jgi:phosphatidylglycerol---prolipoprotein diacylglyceryl transferase